MDGEWDRTKTDEILNWVEGIVDDHQSCIGDDESHCTGMEELTEKLKQYRIVEVPLPEPDYPDDLEGVTFDGEI